jgi:hypothetical protein
MLRLHSDVVFFKVKFGILHLIPTKAVCYIDLKGFAITRNLQHG